MSAKYIIRLDDACDTMNKCKWDWIEKILDKYNIKPIVAVVPMNQDNDLIYDNQDTKFWDKVKIWDNKGWNIALHGFNHLLLSNSSGIVPINPRSEFAGVTLKEQSLKIKKGIEIFNQHGIIPQIWVAPAHTFDQNTLTALKNSSDIKVISDGIAFKPFCNNNFIWVPQQIWHFRKMYFGSWTCCLHPNSMTEVEFDKLESFIKKNHRNFTCIDNYDLKKIKNDKNLFDKIFTFLFFKFKIKTR